jgi:antirestriction protein ArdC
MRQVGFTRPLRSNLVPYQGINVLMLWAEAVEKGFDAPIWMTFKQALELGGHVRQGEKGPVVYASSFTRSETDESSGEESERQAETPRVRVRGGKSCQSRRRGRKRSNQEPVTHALGV